MAEPTGREAQQATGAPAIEVRKIVTVLEEIHHEGGPVADPPRRGGAVAAVIRNPYAGRYVADILPMMEALKPLGLALAKRLIEALGGKGAVGAYGKGAGVGAGG